MKKFFIGLVFLALLPLSVHAVYVNGYYRSNGTYVNGYERTAPDGNPYNNYSYPGNYNPNTGTITGGSASSYLDNYYKNSSGSSGYSYVPSTPTCPSFSSYDSVSGSCKCVSGYVIDKYGSCSSGTSVCYQKYGYGSTFDYSSKSCKCSYGYQFDADNQCVTNQTYCTNNFGYGAEYNSLKDGCYCRSGYSFNSVTERCVLQTVAYTPPTVDYSSLCKVSFGDKSYGDKDYCYCQSGYEFVTNSLGSKKCALKEYTTPVSATITNSSKSSGDSVCKVTYGENSFSHLTNNLCYCSLGSEWNSTLTKCIVGGKGLISQPVKKGMSGANVVNLKNFLAVKGYYSKKVVGSYDSELVVALSNFQKDTNLPSTGSVDYPTLGKINNFILGK